MRPIHPICEDTCKAHYGKPVLVILKDGGEIAGILTKFGDGKIILNGDNSALTNSVKSVKKPAAKNNKTSKGKAKVSYTPYPYPYPPIPYYPPFYPYGGRLVLELALIALLFALV